MVRLGTSWSVKDSLSCKLERFNNLYLYVNLNLTKYLKSNYFGIAVNNSY